MNSTDGNPGTGTEPEAEAGAGAGVGAGAGADAGIGTGSEARPESEAAARPDPAAARGRLVRKVLTGVAVGAVCTGLTWAALSLTGTPSDAKPAAAAPAAAGCTYTATGGGPKGLGLPVHDRARARPYTAELVTDQGKVTLEAFTEAAPCSTTSFAFLAGRKYFDGSACHRVTTSGIFVLECGDPAGLGSADPGYFFPDENLGDATYPAGTVAMSKAVPGRNGSQFFISYADPGLRMQPQWTPFARVVGGLDVLRKIAANGTEDGSTDGRPKEPVVIRSVTVRQAADRH